MDWLLRLTAQYQQKALSFSLSSNKPIKDIFVYLKRYFEGAASTSNYRWYYNDFSHLYDYITTHNAIPAKILDKNYNALISLINSALKSDSVSPQIITKLDELWGSWNISNVAILKSNQVSAINKLINRAIDLLNKK